ncbi:MAG: hypothetical protein METHP_01767 [Methanoregula sp. SKADARSKE-2]|nr:MAG: hypothetical protein METHP_01767 [Methanoregula sp. SKADARSKE-2]
MTLGLIWSTTLSFLPIFILGGSPTATTYVVSIFLYAFFFINTTLFDMRDVIGDRLAGICTIPVYAGMPLTKLALSTINITLGAIGAWYFVNINAYSEVLLIAVATAFTQTLILTFDRYGSNHGFCDIFADGEFIIIGVFLLMTDSVSQLIAHVF